MGICWVYCKVQLNAANASQKCLKCLQLRNKLFSHSAKTGKWKYGNRTDCKPLLHFQRNSIWKASSYFARAEAAWKQDGKKTDVHGKNAVQHNLSSVIFTEQNPSKAFFCYLCLHLPFNSFLCNLLPLFLLILWLVFKSLVKKLATPLSSNCGATLFLAPAWCWYHPWN